MHSLRACSRSSLMAWDLSSDASGPNLAYFFALRRNCSACRRNFSAWVSSVLRFGRLPETRASRSHLAASAIFTSTIVLDRSIALALLTICRMVNRSPAGILDLDCCPFGLEIQSEDLTANVHRPPGVGKRTGKFTAGEPGIPDHNLRASRARIENPLHRRNILFQLLLQLSGGLESTQGT